MLRFVIGALVVLCSALVVQGYRYDQEYVQYNLNQNQSATSVYDYWGEWTGHDYTASPENWRFPFYTIFLDRFVNGDPSNDDINGTAFERDTNSNQLRHGGDIAGLVDTLDYLHGMGIKGLYIAGSPFLNQPWGYDQYSPIDLSILDHHFGTIDVWRTAVNEIHARGMYVLLDNVFATMGDLIGFDGHLNITAPFKNQEYTVQYKSAREYWDFSFGNERNDTCDFPRLWDETGYPVDSSVTDQLQGCYNSEFDQFGSVEAFGVHPDWQRQLAKFADVQDRLREWHVPTRKKLENFYCMLIAQLDIDGFRYDKATQSTVDAMGFMNDAMRTCARRYNKKNFFLPGEITGGNTFGSLFIGRGRQPDMLPENLTQAVSLTNTSDDKYFIRDPEFGGLDAGAFHYTLYRTLTRFLGMDGNLEAGYDAPRNWVDMWNTFLLTNDMVNSNTGVFDPRHMWGTSNQDVFRWPAIANGVQRQLLGTFITAILMPGLPLYLWAEEQASYVLDNTASNYIFGRSPMSSALAWQTHGCYHLGSTQYFNMPWSAALKGCEDDKVSRDHRDPSHPVRSVIKRMHQLRDNFPVLNDGFFLQQLSNQTDQIVYPGSSGVETETGMWSVMRSEFAGVQDLSTSTKAATPVWLIYSNLNVSKTYQFDCSNNDTALNITALIAPYDSGASVRNLFYPYDEHVLIDSSRSLGINGSTKPNGCLAQLDMAPYDFKAYVPTSEWFGPKPMITSFSPGHDARILSTVGVNETEDLVVELQFSGEMDCESVTKSIQLNSTASSSARPMFDADSVLCSNVADALDHGYVGQILSSWSWKATLQNVSNGVHALTVRNASSVDDGGFTNSIDRFIFRIGQSDNPIVFPRSANYSTSLLLQNSDSKRMTLNHSASGADSWRYSTNFGSSFSNWMPYNQGGLTEIEKQPWSGTKLQAWKGDHIRVEYYSKLAGSSDHVQEADIGKGVSQRRIPNAYLNGPYNQYGYDAGLENSFHIDGPDWTRHWMVEWDPAGSVAQVNVWGMNPDGKPDATYVLGDVDGDSVLDRLPPSSLSDLVLNITQPPPHPHLAWKIMFNDGTMRFWLTPAGSMWQQLILYILLWTIPLLTAVGSTWIFMQSFYKIKFNEIGVSDKRDFIPMVLKRAFRPVASEEPDEKPRFLARFKPSSKFLQEKSTVIDINGPRRKVLIATMEYDIEDWAIKIKIGGLGVMAQLMGKNLAHQDLIWVIPCVGDVEYPRDEAAPPMKVRIMGVEYEINVQYHKLRNITYVLLDAPVFRQQTKSDPYPARMDDMTSAIYYSAWNQCVANTIQRFDPTIYYINDYHATVAPLYLLPHRTIPACLALHNAEFQGLWPMRNKQEREEVCSVFNLPEEIVAQYVQFGEVFNLLHAGASYLRVHQQGFGAVGVSKKYGKRAYARYPIFWGLSKIAALQNPDPSDTAEWDKHQVQEEDIRIDPDFEAGRADLRRQAQEWAGLETNPAAQLFVFVGRWSMQKGVDLIADVFPAVLDSNPDVQLICIGPVIDLYGKFAALKLDKMMKLYPGRVCSKPVFTALPPFVFSGAEFALIPSRDEPFGLVAVEFGRKGALGVGARVGGLGQMPGWWYTVEATTVQHLTKQFRQAIEEALSSKQETRAIMRARSAKQRFPVAEWKESLELLQTTAIRMHDKVKSTKKISTGVSTPFRNSGVGPFASSGAVTPSGAQTPNFAQSRQSSQFGLHSLGARLRSLAPHSREVSYDSTKFNANGFPGTTTMGSAQGPGHIATEDQNDGAVTRTVLSPINDHDGIEHGSRQPSGRFHEVFDAHDDDDSESSDGDEPMTMPTQARTRDSPTLPRFDFALGPTRSRRPSGTETPSARTMPDLDAELLPPQAVYNTNRFSALSATGSMLSIDQVVGEKTDYNLQKVDPFFTDSNGEFYRAFEKRLETLNASNSESTNCIEEFLIKSEKDWFDKYRNAKLGRLGASGNRSSSYMVSRPASIAPTEQSRFDHSDEETAHDTDSFDEFLLGKDYTPPSGIKKWMQIKMGGSGWPTYAFFLALGQIISANSYQVTLLTGEVGQSENKLYVIASIYLATSIMWWMMFRRFQSVLALSLPWFFYGLAFILIGTAHYASTVSARGWIQNLGAAMYAVASSSGSLFFALNFGDEGGAHVKSWVFRACAVSGTQQIYVVALWYWGSLISRRSREGIDTKPDPIASTWKITAITLPIGIFLWTVGLLIWFGLPKFYRQAPGSMPSFYKSLTRRKIVLWFFVAVIIQNFFLSAPYGRNWSFLFSSAHAETWQVMLLVVFFFIIVWAGILAIFGHLSKSHSWILPLFAIGLGAPRWAQIWWGTSNIGLYLPWAGSLTSGALASRALWLWLGVLDSIQGVGLGMILLGTLTRVHVAATLIMAQVLGSVATIIARAVSPNKLGPGPISPDISNGLGSLWQAWFWVGLILNLSIALGFYKFYRKEQLQKP